MKIEKTGTIVSWDARDCSLGERFVVIEPPFHLSESYVGTIVLGANGFECIDMWVIGMTAYKQKFVQCFEEVK